MPQGGRRLEWWSWLGTLLHELCVTRQAGHQGEGSVLRPEAAPDDGTLKLSFVTMRGSE